MKQTNILIFLFIAMFSSFVYANQTNSNSQNDYYFSVSVGSAKLNDLQVTQATSSDGTILTNPYLFEFDSSSIYAISVGKKIKQYRLDLEMIQSEFSVLKAVDTNSNDSIIIGSSNNNNSGKLKTQSLFLNAYYDFEKINNFQPFVGIGLGNSKIIDLSASASRVTKFSYQFKLGAYYLLNDRSSFSIFYRNLRTNSFTFSGSTVDFEGINQNSLEIGYKFNF